MAATVVVALVLLTGCTRTRQTLNADQLRAREHQRFADLKKYDAVVTERVVRRMKRKAEEAAPGHRATFDILILSGGGDYGAFGAGFLRGWGEVHDAELARPTFDKVNGVSTGALIAPFAFVGSGFSYDRIAKIYSEPKKDWFLPNNLLGFLFGGESYMEAKGLRRDLETQVDAATLDLIARGEREDRSLWIGTTDLDLGVMYPWDLTEEARRIAEGAPTKRFFDVLMASSAIPVVFPPVIIDGTLYVDGGTTSNILFDADFQRADGPFTLFRERYPSLTPPTFRFWVIINNKVESQERVVRPSWMSITLASIQTAIRASTVSALRHLESQIKLQRCLGAAIEFRYVAIPEEWTPPKPDSEPFDPELMASLLKEGERMGADPRSWKTEVGREVEP